MVVDYQADLDSVFHALADPTRRAMLQALSTDRKTIGELAAPFDMSLAAASKHVKVLEQACLIRRTVQGRLHVCTLDTRPLAEADAFLRSYERFWDERLAALDALFDPKARRN